MVPTMGRGDLMNCPSDERQVLRSVMAKPWLLASRDWSFVIGLQERADAPFSAAEKIKLAELHRQVRNMTNDD